MDRKQVKGKVLVVGAGTAVLALAIFVLLPWLTAPPNLMAPANIAQEVPMPETPVKEDTIEAASPEDELEEDKSLFPSPLVGLRDNGEEVAVIFPAAAGEPPQSEASTAGEGPSGMEGDEVPAGPAEGLPPLLSPEEVVAAIEGLDGGGQEDAGAVAADERERLVTEGARVPEADISSTTQPTDPVRGVQAERRRRAVAVGEDTRGRHVEAPLPPPSATREVQELLEALGYAPGPADGIWGERTEKAWNSFARDAAALAARAETPESNPGEFAAPSALEFPTPSGETLESEGRGARQAGDGRRQAGLPPIQPPVIVPDNLRGVMGYRMPLVSRQGVPDQVVSGVLIPSHTTFVVLKPGYWELVGLEPSEVERLREADERESVPASEVDTQPVKRGWNPLRLFRKQGPHANGD